MPQWDPKRAYLKKKNMRIIAAYVLGSRLKVLAQENGLSHSRVYQLINHKYAIEKREQFKMLMEYPAVYEEIISGTENPIESDS